MNATYEWLFSRLAEPALSSMGYCDKAWVEKLAAAAGGDGHTLLRLYDEILDRQMCCARDAFTMGVYLGLQLLSLPQLRDFAVD